MLLEISIAGKHSLGIVVGLLVVVEDSIRLCQDFDNDLHEGDYVRVDNSNQVTFARGLMDIGLDNINTFDNAKTVQKNQTRLLKMIQVEQQIYREELIEADLNK